MISVRAKRSLRQAEADLPQSLLGEENVQSLSVIGVCLSVQKHPVLLEQDLGG